MDNCLAQKDIDKLTSKLWYSKFENGVNDCENFYSKINDYYDKSDSYYDLRSVSDKILKALCYVYREKVKNLNHDEELCSYLYYWLGDKIYPLVNNNEHVFKNIILKMYKELNDNNPTSMAVCSYNYNLIDLHRYKEYKLLFDYSKDFRNIEHDTHDDQRPCDEYYYNYINEYIKIYKEAYLECKSAKKGNFYCIYFSNLFQKNEYNKLSSFTCKKRNNIVVSEKQKLQEQQTASDQSNHEASVRSPFPQQIEAPSANLEINKHTGGQNIPTTIDPIHINGTNKGGHSKSITSSVVPVLGVPFISFLLYRFTPAGGFINKLLGKNSNMYNPIVDIDGSNPYSEGMVDGHRRMNISYHRL